MDTIEIVVMLISVLALVGIVIFFVYTYITNKDATDKRIADTEGLVKNEQTNRLSNIKYVVDEVNTVNQSIYNTFSSSNLVMQKTLTSNSNAIVNLDNEFTGFNKILSFSNYKDGKVMKLTDLPGVPNSGVKASMLTEFIATMGLTGQNLSTYPVNFCEGTRCIKFPDANGNTYLTNLGKDGSIVMDAPTIVKNNLSTQSVNIYGKLYSSNVSFCPKNIAVGDATCTTFDEIEGPTIAAPSGKKIKLNGNTELMGTNKLTIPATTAAGTTTTNLVLMNGDTLLTVYVGTNGELTTTNPVA
jgi:hypothetical protein